MVWLREFLTPALVDGGGRSASLEEAPVGPTVNCEHFGEEKNLFPRTTIFRSSSTWPSHCTD